MFLTFKIDNLGVSMSRSLTVSTYIPVALIQCL